MAAIVEASQCRNPSRGFTGFLINFDDVIVQYIGGPSPAVEQLISTLRGDPRHADFEILYDCYAEKRWFADWGMMHLISFATTPAMQELRNTLLARPEGHALYEKIRVAIENAPVGL